MAKLVVHNPQKVKLKTSGYMGEPTGTIEITKNGEYNVKQYATADVKVPQPSGETTLTKNNTTYNVAQYESAKVQIPEEEKTVTPSTAEQVVTPDNGLLKKVTVEGVTSSIDPDIQPENIKQGVNILGVTGTVEPKPPVVESKWIDFIDYDGTLLYSWTKEELEQASELPPAPTHEGLTFQEWNWTLADLKAENLSMIVGAIFITDNLKTRLKFLIDDYGSKTISLRLYNAQGQVDIDWGDGTTEHSSNYMFSHTYAEKGIYIVELYHSNSYELYLSDNNTRIRILEAYFGSNASIRRTAFDGSTRLKLLTLSNDVLSIPHLTYCSSLTAIITPSACSSFEGTNNSASKTKISLSKSVASLSSSAFANSILEKINLPRTITSILYRTFHNTRGLFSVYIPKNIKKFEAQSFYNCTDLLYLDLSEYDDPNDIPVLDNTNAFTGVLTFCVFLAKNQSMVDAFSTSTNWSTYADKFQIKEA